MDPGERREEGRKRRNIKDSEAEKKRSQTRARDVMKAFSLALVLGTIYYYGSFKFIEFSVSSVVSTGRNEDDDDASNDDGEDDDDDDAGNEDEGTLKRSASRRRKNPASAVGRKEDGLTGSGLTGNRRTQSRDSLFDESVSWKFLCVDFGAGY